MYLSAGINRFGKSQFIDPVIQQHRVLLIAIHKKSGCKTHDEITVRHLLLKHGSGKISCFYMCIEMISTQVSEFVNVFRCDDPFLCDELIADLQFLKIFCERMSARVFTGTVLLVNIRDGRDSCW